MSEDAVIRIKPLGFPWQTADPFLFCVHHDDAYPAGNERMGRRPRRWPAATSGRTSRARTAGACTTARWCPGFPQHPHRGFETVTIVRRGLIDHSDSLGAAARFGGGDVQWLTAGKGIVHSEMFPLLDRNGPNPLELFQIWLNLPARRQDGRPALHDVVERPGPPAGRAATPTGRTTEVTVVAGRLGDAAPPPPPPNSWAARPDTDVAIWTITHGARRALDAARRPPPAPTARSTSSAGSGPARRRARRPARTTASSCAPTARSRWRPAPTSAELLLLQGRPIGEPVAQYGPFVMNTRAEIQQAFIDYQRTQFGGWPWPSDDPVHAARGGPLRPPRRRPRGKGSVDQSQRALTPTLSRFAGEGEQPARSALSVPASRPAFASPAAGGRG